MFKYIMVFVTLAYALMSQASTLNERMTDIQGANGVLAARLDGTPELVIETPSIHLGRITYWTVDVDTVERNTVAIVIVNYNAEGEAAYWLSTVPEPLRPAPVAETYITDRVAGAFSAATIESFVNAAWRELVHNDARDIRDFSVSAVDGSTVRVSGSFHLVDNTWASKSYYIHIINTAGNLDIKTVAGKANIEFQPIGGATP